MITNETLEKLTFLFLQNQNLTNLTEEQLLQKYLASYEKFKKISPKSGGRFEDVHGI